MPAEKLDECTLWIWQTMLSKPERFWRLPDFSLDYIGTRTNRAGEYWRSPLLWNDRHGARVLADLAESGWAQTDDGGDGYQLTDTGVSSLTWLVRTRGRERGLIGTFLWEGGSAARQKHASQHTTRSTPTSHRGHELDAEFDQTEVHGFWWTLPRHGIAAALAARAQRRAQQRALRNSYSAGSRLD